MDLTTVTALLPAPDVAWEPGDAWLGGGTWLFSQEQPEVRRLLDLRAFGWPPFTTTRGRPGDRRDLHPGGAGPGSGHYPRGRPARSCGRSSTRCSGRSR